MNECRPFGARRTCLCLTRQLLETPKNTPCADEQTQSDVLIPEYVRLPQNLHLEHPEAGYVGHIESI